MQVLQPIPHQNNFLVLVVSIWDANTGKVFVKSSIHPDQLSAPVYHPKLNWSPDGNQIAYQTYRSLSLRGDYFETTIWIWDGQTGEQKACTPHPGTSVYLQWSPDSRFIVSRSNPGLHIPLIISIWDVQTGKATLTSRCDKVPDYAFWSPKGRYIAFRGDDGIVKVWDAQTGHEVFSCLFHANDLYQLSWSPDGKFLAHKDRNASLQVWDVQARKEVFSYIDPPVDDRGQWRSIHRSDVFAWAPNGKQFASIGKDSKIRIWDIQTSKELLLSRHPGNDVMRLVWSPDSKLVASTYSYLGSRNYRFQMIWDSYTDRVILVNDTQTGCNGPHAPAWSPDGKYFAAVVKDDTVNVWELIYF